MFTGAGNGTERFHITVPANSDNANIFTTQNGFLAFGTNNTERLRITAAGEIQIKALACNGCIVTTNQQGQLIADNQLVNLSSIVKFCVPLTNVICYQLFDCQ